MDVNRRQELLSDYLENTLSASDKAAMDAEVKNNPEARAEVAALRSVWNGLDDLASAPGQEAPMFFRDNVMAQIERQGARKGYWPGERAATQNLPLWQRLFPNAGRLAVGAAFGAALAAVGIFAVNGNLMDKNGIQIAGAGVPVVQAARDLVLPDGGQVAETDAVEAQPRFVVTTGKTLTQDATHACDFTFWLENSPQGSARFTLLNNSGVANASTEPIRFSGMKETTAQTLRIPFDPTKIGALALKVRWTARGTAHDRYLMVPTASQENEAALANTPAPSFTLAEMPLLDALREVTVRTGVPITVEDVPNSAAIRVALSANGNESTSVALRRGLSPLGLRVSRSTAGILITPAQ